MSTQAIEQHASAVDEETTKAGFDPFDLDITFIEGTPAAETVLMCSTGDNCGTSCPSACTTS
jgi:FxLD family lantipeptide